MKHEHPSAGDSNMPPDQFSPLMATSVELFTAYTEFLRAGFTEQQALVLVNSALVTHMQINAVIEEQRRREGRG